VEVGLIDWQAPWLAPWRGVGEAAARSIAAEQSQVVALNHAASVLPGFPMRFVAQCELPEATAYEQHIFDTACIPTREGLHDFFNGLAWLQFPLTKKRLNQLHVAQIAQTGIQPVRGPARDGLTLFDENAAVLQAPDALWDALAAKDWQALFGPLRPLWQEAQLLLFGHALLEKLVQARKGITAHVYRAPACCKTAGELDVWLAQDLSAEKLASKPFAHLPVLGVPHWWQANEDPQFYADSGVFRLPRS
jgi:hypothetical protein